MSNYIHKNSILDPETTKLVDISNNSGEFARNLENKFRKLFVANRDSELLDDLFVTLVPAYQKYDSFKLNLLKDTNTNVLASGFSYLKDTKLSTGDYSIVPKDKFIENFNLFTEYQLADVNWDNLFVAGGAVLASMLHVPTNYDKNNDPLIKRNYYHNQQYPDSDIDIFIYGLDEDAAMKKIQEVYQSIIKRVPYKVICFRTPNAVTIMSQHPYRHIQIVLRLYKSPAEILMCFDVDCCSVGYDGNQVWTTPRARDALVKMTNTVDVSRRSPSYEYRLWKYANRGFSIELPNLQEDKIDPQIYLKKVHKSQGLAKLFLLMNTYTEDNRVNFIDNVRENRLRPQKKENVALLNKLCNIANNSSIMLDQPVDVSDYSTVYMPWGPQWNCTKVSQLMKTKDRVLNSEEYDPDRKYPTHPCFMGDMVHIIKDCAPNDNFNLDQIPEDERQEFEERYVYGTLKWKSINPGEQRIGSFHPIDDEGWEEGSYVNSLIQELHKAVVSGNNTKVLDLIQDKVDLNRKDFAGRTPVQLAVLYNNKDALMLLLDAGAKISYKLDDGRSAFHLACELGDSDTVTLILNYGKQLQKKIAEANTNNTNKYDESAEFSLKKIAEMHKKANLDNLLNVDDDAKLDKVLEEDLDSFDPNDSDWDYNLNPLFTTVLFNHLDLFKLLLNNPLINKNTKWKLYDKYNSQYHTYTLLQLCVKLNRVNFIEYMINVSYNIIENNQGEYILNQAVKANNLSLIKIFIEKGKHPIDCFNKNGWSNINTPLTVAINNYLISKGDKNLDIVSYLISKGAKTYYDIKDVPSIKELIKMGASSNSETFYKSITQPYNQIVTSNDFPLINLLVKYDKKFVNFVFYNQFLNPKYYTSLDQTNCSIDNINLSIEDSNAQLVKIAESSLYKSNKAKSFNDDELEYEEIRAHNRRRDKSTIEADLKTQQDRLYDLQKIKQYLKKNGAKKVVAVPYYAEKISDKTSLEVVEKVATKKVAIKKVAIKKVASKNVTINAPTVEYYAINHKKDSYSTTSTYYCHKYNNVDKYNKFYEAVYTGDSTKIVNLTNSSDPVHVCSFSSLSKRSPLHIAAQKDDVSIFVLLMDIACQQYTPIEYTKKSVAKHIPTINNAYLKSIMENINYNNGSESESESDTESKDLDTQKIPDKIVSLADPDMMLSMNTCDKLDLTLSDGNLLSTIINHNSYKCYKALFDYPNFFNLTKVTSLLKSGKFHHKFVKSSMINYLSHMLQNTEELDDKDNLLVDAVKCAKAESILFLVKYYKDYNCLSTSDVFNIDYRDKKNNTLLHTICKIKLNSNNSSSSLGDYIKCIKLILTMKPDLINYVNDDGNTALQVAADNNYNIFQTLLEFGVDPLVYNNKGYQVVHNVVFNNRIDLIDILLRFDDTLLNSTTRIENFTPLVVALRSKKLEVSKHLISRNADLNIITDVYGNIPMHYMCINSYSSLISEISSSNIENNFGLTPQDILKQVVKQSFHHKLTYKSSSNILDADKAQLCINQNTLNNRSRTNLENCNEVYKFIRQN